MLFVQIESQKIVSFLQAKIKDRNEDGDQEPLVEVGIENRAALSSGVARSTSEITEVVQKLD